MRQYVEIDSCYTRQINDKLADGWEVIDKTTSVHPDGEETMTYHIGYPAEKRIEDLKGIIKKYESFGLKEVLFDKVAEENGNTVDMFKKGSGFGTNDPTAKFMTRYEKLVDNSENQYYEKRSSIEF